MEKQNARKGVSAFFKRKSFIERLQKSLLEPYWDCLIDIMNSYGYSYHTIYCTIEYTLPFIEYAANFGIFLPHCFTEEIIKKFLDTLENHPRTQKDTRCALHRVMNILQEQNLIHKDSPTNRKNDLLEDYLSFLLNHRGLSASRIKEHRRYIGSFLEMLTPRNMAGDMLHLQPDNVHKFINTNVSMLSRYGRISMCAVLRVFLRFLLLQDYIPRDLVSCVPVIPQFKLERLPSVIERNDIEKILAAINQSTVVGRRDYAMLLLLATYGLRSLQICKLRIDDINWRHKTIRIPAVKGGKPTILPLDNDVGEALVKYLCNGRPNRPDREIFLRVRAPIRPLYSHSITLQIRRYAQQIRLKRPFSAHAWRHSCATQILAKGISLKTIRDVLGHKNISTTFIYTKVDVHMLRQAALDWPEVTTT